jgi:hypothetical protein
MAIAAAEIWDSHLPPDEYEPDWWDDFVWERDYDHKEEIDPDGEVEKFYYLPPLNPNYLDLTSPLQ